MALAELASARKSRASHRRFLEDRIEKSKVAIDKCKNVNDDITLAAGARYIIDKANESLAAYEDAIIRIGEFIETHKPLQTQAQRDEDEMHEGLVEQHTTTMDGLCQFLARCESYVATIQVGNRRPNAVSAAKPHVKAPQQLEHDSDLANFVTWRQSFKDWAIATNIVNGDKNQYVAHLRSLLSTKMKSTLEHSIGIGATSNLDVDEILAALQAHIRATRSIAIDRVEFEKRVQGAKEKFNDYYVDLKKLSQNANILQCCLEARLITRLMAGCHDSEVREELMEKHDNLTLAQAVEIARSKEAAKRSASTIVKSGEISVNAVRSSTPKSKYKSSKIMSPQPKTPSHKVVPQSSTPSPQQNKQGNKNSNSTGCSKCGFPTHTRKDGKCPALEANCGTCNRKGHFANMCRSKTSQGRHVKALSVRHAHRDDSSPTIKVDIHHKGLHRGSTCAFPDSAAEVSIAGPKFLDDIAWEGGQLNLNPPSEQIFAANRTGFLVLGSLNLEIHYRGRSALTEIFIVDSPSDLLIEWKACIDLGILPANFPEPIGESREVRQVSKAVGWFSPKVEVSKLGPIPDEPSEAEVSRLRDKILELYPDVFCETKLSTMRCKPYKIELTPDAVPIQCTTARAIPVALRDSVKREIDEMLKNKIIAPVLEATDWVHPICCVPKPCGGLRFTVDLRGLNKYVKRPVHPLTTPIQAVQSIPTDAKWFSTADAKKGYWQIELAKESQKLTTFLTPWGRYCFLRAPMGLSATGDVYCREGDLALAGISNVTKVVDDILIATNSFRDNVTRVIEVLNRCRLHRITLHPGKLVFGQKNLGFVGMLLSEDGIKSDPEKIRAIAEFPAPTNLTQLRSFLGMIGALPTLSSQITTLISPLRELRKTKNEFIWQPEHSEAFEALKCHIVNSDTTLTFFDPSRPTRLETDASRLHGLGFVLRQLHDSHWKIVQCGSRFLSDTESRYSVIELELLALTWATRKLHVYLFGLDNYEVFLDHAPLIPILNTYTLGAVENPRLMRLKEKLQTYKFTAHHIKGKDNVISDALSRAPIRDPLPGEEEGEENESNDSRYVRAIITRSMAHAHNSPPNSPTVDSNLEWVKIETANDPACTLIRTAIRKGFPNTIRQVHPLVRPFWGVRNELSESEGLILRNGIQIIIPQKIRKEVLSRLHSSHQGIDGTRRRARKSVFWPGVNSDISSTVGSCAECQEYLPSQAQEPLCSETIPSVPFEEVSTDLFSESGQSFLVMTDLFTGWPQVYRWYNDPTTRQVVNVLKHWFSSTGIPLRLKSDNGPQYSSDEFNQFCTEWHITHVTSTPYYAQSNSHAELCVKQIKRLVQKVGTDIYSDKFLRGMLEIRNTPRSHGKSPAELLYHQPMRSHVPSIPPTPSPQAPQVEMHRERERQAKKQEYDRTAKPLLPLDIGQTVLVQDHRSRRWSHRGVVVSKGPRRDYHVDVGRNKTMHRNRRFIRPIPDDPI